MKAWDLATDLKMMPNLYPVKQASAGIAQDTLLFFPKHYVLKHPDMKLENYVLQDAQWKIYAVYIS